MRDDLLARAVADDATTLEQDRAVAQLGDRLQVVGHEDHRAAGVAEVLHPAEAARLELGVADGQHLVDEQDLGLEVRRDGEREPHVHAARVALHGRVEELGDAREVHDLGQLLLDLLPLHAEDRAVQVDVLATRELGVEPGPDLEQAPDATTDLRAALRRRGDPGQDLEKRRLAGAVPADQAEHLALLHLEGDVPERPDVLPRVTAAPGLSAASRRARATPEASRTPPAPRRSCSACRAPGRRSRRPSDRVRELGLGGAEHGQADDEHRERDRDADRRAAADRARAHRRRPSASR